MRAVITLLVVFGLGSGGVFVAWSHFQPRWTAAQHAQDWRERELAFLKAAYDRLEAQLVKATDGSSDSLRSEQQVIRQMMADSAKALPLDQVPSEIRVVLGMPSPGTQEQSGSATVEAVTGPQTVTSATAPVPVPPPSPPAAAGTTAPSIVPMLPAAAASPAPTPTMPVASSVPAPPSEAPAPRLRAGLTAPVEVEKSPTDLSRDPGLDLRSGRTAAKR